MAVTQRFSARHRHWPLLLKPLNLIAGSVASQRQGIAAMQAQLKVLDEQLAMLEEILGPLAEWSKTWAEFEDLVMNARREAGPEG